MTAFAHTEVVFVLPDGSRVRGRIVVHAPVQSDEVEARCEVDLVGLWAKSFNAAGVDTLQALLLGVRYLAMSLRAFLESGGQVIHVNTDDPVPLDAFFGSLVGAESGATR